MDRIAQCKFFNSAFSGPGFEINSLYRRARIELEFACDNDKFVKESFFNNYNINDDCWYDDIQELSSNTNLLKYN